MFTTVSLHPPLLSLSPFIPSPIKNQNKKKEEEEKTDPVCPASPSLLHADHILETPFRDIIDRPLRDGIAFLKSVGVQGS